MEHEWYYIKDAKRCEARLLSLATSTYLEVIHRDEIFIYDGLNKAKSTRRFFTFRENCVPTPPDLVVFKNTRYSLAISDKLYKVKDCDTVALPSISLDPVRQRLFSLPTMGLPKFLFSEKNTILFFFIPKNLYSKKGDMKVKNKVVPRLVITDYTLTGNRKFYENSYPLPYVIKFDFFPDLFYLNVDFDYIIHEKEKNQDCDYRVYFLPTEIPIQELHATPSENNMKCLQKTLEILCLTNIKVSLQEDKVKIEKQ